MKAPAGAPGTTGNPMVAEQTALLDARGAGALLNVPPSWVLAEAREGRIPHLRLGRYVRFEADELAAWVEARRQGPRRRTGSRPVPVEREAA